MVDSRGAAEARSILRDQGLRARETRSPGRVSFSIANRADESGDEAIWPRELATALQRGRVPVVMFRAPYGERAGPRAAPPARHGWSPPSTSTMFVSEAPRRISFSGA